MNEKPVEILIVDDDPQMLKYVSMILEKEGYDVMTADNGKAALESAIKEKPDLVLSDILMPVMDGFQLCREIRLDRRVQFTPVILYSASYVDKEDEQLGKDVGADSYLRKPLEREKLLATIDGLVSRRSSVSISQASEEEIFYQKYNETLVQKLENRTVQLETENQKLKETLQDSKRSSEWYREVFDGINVAAVVFDATTRECVEVNRSALHLYGYTRKEFLGISPEELLHEGQMDDSLLLDLDKLRKGVTVTQTRRRKNGRPFPAEVSLSVLRIGGQDFIVETIREGTSGENQM